MEDNVTFFDSWNLPHFLAGVLLKDLSFKNFMFLIIAYEIFEYSIEYPRGHWLFGSKRPETLTNVIGDILFALAGRYSAQKVFKNA